MTANNAQPQPGFNPTLEANRRGQITPSQRKMLTAQGRQVSWAYLIPLILLPAFIIAVSNVYADSMRGREALLLLPIGLIAAIVFLSMLVQFLRCASVMSEVNAGQIAVGEGQVVCQGKMYEASVAGRRLRPLDGTLALVPGSYRFYYLARSGWLLSHEPLGNAAYGNMELAHVLLRAFRSSPATLAANRRGIVTVGQRLTVAGKGIAGLVLALGLFIAVEAMAVSYAPHGQDGEPWIACGILGVCALLVLGWAVRNLADITAGVAVLEGPVVKKYEVHASARSTSHKYYYIIGNERFSVSQTAYMALVERLPYRLYYLPHSKKLLNIEPTTWAAINPFPASSTYL